METLVPVDLSFQGVPRQIAAYLLDSPDGPMLFDCGPSSTLPRLREGLHELGVELSDIRHLLLSHIHLDHAGAAGSIVREQPELTIWVSEIGAPHLVDPSRLERSARRLYGDAFDTLWGELVAVPQRNVRIAAGNVLGWETFPTPGHASHHVCYLRDGTLLAGDACGVRVQPSRHILPVAPPPDIDLDAWEATLAEIERRSPERLALTHFGIETGVADHVQRLREELSRWAARVESGMSLDEFVEAGQADAGADLALYDRMSAYSQSWLGLRRYWDAREEALG